MGATITPTKGASLSQNQVLIFPGFARNWSKFPTGCGKAHDATLVCRWLEKELENASVDPQVMFYGYWSILLAFVYHIPP